MPDFEQDTIESDVEPVSSEPSQSEPESTSEPTEPEQSVPYSRFKEVNEQQKQYAAQMAEMQRKIDALSQRTSKEAEPQAQPKASPYEKVLARLQGIDPEFAELIKHTLSKAEKVEPLEASIQQRSAEDVRKQANSTVDSLFSEHKVPESDKALYRARIRTMAMDDPNVKMEDLPKLFKSVHEDHTKYLDGIRRSEREKYVSEKRTDGKQPNSQPKGTPTKGAPKKDFPTDREEAKAELVKQLMEKRRAASDI